MASSGFHYCTVCRGRYRGSSAVHAGTIKHRAAVRGPRDTYKDLRAHQKIRRAPTRQYEGEDHVKVNKYRRRRPLDGPRRTVKVRRYWRTRVYGLIFRGRIGPSASELAHRFVR